MDDWTIESLNRVKMDKPHKWVQKFNVDSYVNNIPMIERLNQEKQEYLLEKTSLESKLKTVEEEKNRLEKSNIRMEQEISHLRSSVTLMKIIDFFMMMILAIGVNLVTSDPSSYIGFSMIFIPAIWSMVSFFLGK